MFQPDLFTKSTVADDRERGTAASTPRILPSAAAPQLADRDRHASLDLPAVLERLAEVSTRPRYTFMVLNLIARAAGTSDSAGPYVRDEGQDIPVRDWLSKALLPMAQRDARRRAVVEEVRAGLRRRGVLPADAAAAEHVVAEEVCSRLLHSGRTNVSRAVSDLVRAGLLRRHYQGYRVDHENRGAQREAVYTITAAARQALGKGA